MRLFSSPLRSEEGSPATGAAETPSPSKTKKAAKPKLIKVRILAPLAEELDGEMTRFEPLTDGKPTIASLPEDRVEALGSLVEPA